MWDLLEKPGRSPADNDEMLQAALASLWHWSQRDDCQPRNLAVGYWQASRVQSVLGNGLEARRFGARSAMHAQNEPPFYMAYAHEALARPARCWGITRRWNGISPKPAGCSMKSATRMSGLS